MKIHDHLCWGVNSHLTAERGILASIDICVCVNWYGVCLDCLIITPLMATLARGGLQFKVLYLHYIWFIMIVSALIWPNDALAAKGRFSRRQACVGLKSYDHVTCQAIQDTCIFLYCSCISNTYMHCFHIMIGKKSSNVWWKFMTIWPLSGGYLPL